MNDSSKSGLIIILLVSLLAMSSGTVFGMNHIGETISKEIIPTSLTEPSNTLNVIKENSFEAKNITLNNSTNNSSTNHTTNITTYNTTNTTNYTNITKNNTNITNNTTNDTNDSLSIKTIIENTF
ncbi:hypothetical protein [Methanosphaera sp. WGK6]|uniref:hypothetical protein n=1 Tax=Methanosphaera sp. WGK6 TaxID=1561964 RepID=UPI00084BC3A2|nr:hypothetical protein [Methanosphaera sp. WGK6]OED30724.1 hypothetical protein NL43_01960 [Methanosphaera sp. WGK6]